MENKIIEYVDKKFIVYPKTEKVVALHTDLLSRMMNQYKACKRNGMSEQKSYTLALAEMNHTSGKATKPGMARTNYGCLFDSIA